MIPKIFILGAENESIRMWKFSIFLLTVSLVLVTVIKIWAEVKRLSGSRDMISVIFDEKKVKT